MNKKVFFIVAAIFCAIVVVMNSSNDTTNNDLYNQTFGPVTKSEVIDSADIFFDASGSMKGYLVGSCKPFVDNVAKLLDVSKNTNYYLLGNTIIKYNGKIADLKNNLSLFNGGDTKYETLIPNLCKRVNKGKIVFLVTDGIVYLNKNTSDGLSQFKYDLKNNLSKICNGKEIAFAVLQYHANFSSPQVTKGGICYYNMNNVPVKLECSNKERPFYVIALGMKEDISYLQFKNLEAGKELYLGIHDKNYLVGKMNLEDKKENVNNNLPVILHVTLPDILNSIDKTDNNYLISNLHIYGDGNQKNNLKYEVEKLAPKGNILINVTIQPKEYNRFDSLDFVIDNKIPQKWYEDSEEDDTKFINPKRTFGLKYLLEGLKGIEGNEQLIKITFNL